MDSVVILPKPVAIEVAKDLIRLDEAEEEVVLLTHLMTVETRKVALQKSIVNEQSTLISNLESKIGLLQEKDTVRGEEITYWKKQYKKQKRQKFLVGGIGIALIILMAL